MEIAIMLFMAVVALGEQDKALDDKITSSEVEILDLKRQDLASAGAIASNHALQQFNHTNQQNQIDSIERRVDLLFKMNESSD